MVESIVVDTVGECDPNYYRTWAFVDVVKVFVADEEVVVGVVRIVQVVTVVVDVDFHSCRHFSFEITMDRKNPLLDVLEQWNKRQYGFFLPAYV